MEAIDEYVYAIDIKYTVFRCLKYVVKEELEKEGDIRHNALLYLKSKLDSYTFLPPERAYLSIRILHVNLRPLVYKLVQPGTLRYLKSKQLEYEPNNN